MSLLDSPNAEVIVYPQEVWTDEDGNTMLRPSAVGTTTPATVRPQPQSGTSSRRAEQMDEGFFTEEVYNLRFPKGSPGDLLGTLGAMTRVDWNGGSWSVFGPPLFYNGSRRTRRHEYTMRRN